MSIRGCSALLLLIVFVTILSSPAEAQPDPAMSTVPNLILTPDGSIPYVVTVRNSSGTPLEGIRVKVVVDSLAQTILCWCSGQSPNRISTFSDASGNATFTVRGGGCIDPAVYPGGAPVSVIAGAVLLATVGVVSTDVTHGGSDPDLLQPPLGPCVVDLSDMGYHAGSFQTATGFCSDLNSDGVVDLAEAVTIVTAANNNASCVSQDPGSPPMGANLEPRVAFHAQPFAISKKGECGLFDFTVPYSDFITTAPEQAPLLVYLLVARADSTAGVSGVSVGMEATGSLALSWDSCADFDFNLGNWGSGTGSSGNRIVWLAESNCQRQTIGTDGVHAVAGVFYVYAYGPSLLTLTPFPGQSTAKVMDCSYRLNEVDPACLGAVSFGYDGSDPSRPMLPNSCQAPDNDTTGAGWVFVDVPTGTWCDPDVVYGFDFEMTSGSLFTAVADFPPGFPAPFTVSVEGVVLGSFTAGQPVDFSAYAGTLGPLLIGGEGVLSFEITDIDPLVADDDPLAFPVLLDFNTPTADFTMTGILDPALVAVPDPSGTISLVRAANYPNPFRPATRIRYAIPESGLISVIVYDFEGRVVRTLVSNLRQEAGDHEVQWDGRSDRGQALPAGVYFYRVSADRHATARKMILMR